MKDFAAAMVFVIVVCGAAAVFVPAFVAPIATVAIGLLLCTAVLYGLRGLIRFLKS